MELALRVVGALCLLTGWLATAEQNPTPQRPATPPAKPATSGGGRPASTPAPPPIPEMQKAIDEFKAQTANLGLRADSAGAGANGKGGVSVVAASAQRFPWHGRLFENFRNDFLDAAPKEIRQRGGRKNLLRRHQFGFNVAGPVRIPKVYEGQRNTFFSLSYEGVRERIGRSNLRTIAIPEERGGDFSRTVDSAGAPLPVYDPASTRRNASFNPALPVSEENLEYRRDPFPGNRLPVNRLDPVALAAVPFYPLPNSDAGPFFRNNYFVVSPETNLADGMIAKVEHTFLEKHRLAVNMSFTNGFTGSANLLPGAADSNNPDRAYSNRRGALEHIWTLSPQTINTATFEAVTDRSENVSEATGFASLLGLQEAGSGVFPSFRFGNYLGMGTSNPNARNVRNTYVWTDSFSQRRGKHNVRLIGQWARYQVHSFVPQFPAGSYRFQSGLTSLPGINNTGHAFASFLLGLSDYAEVSRIASPSYFRRSNFLLAFRDQWEISRRLTINFGLNLDVQGPRTEKFNRQSTVDLNTPNAPNGPVGGLVFAGRDGVAESLQPWRPRFEPSLSLTWNPFGDNRTAVRAAYARSYQTIPIYSTQFGTQGFNGYVTFFSPNVQLDPAFVLRQRMPTFPALPDLRASAANDTAADFIDRSPRQPVYQSASLSFERELPNSYLVTGGLGYGHGRDLLVSSTTANLNAIHPDLLSFRDQLNNEAFRRRLRPYPQYLGFDMYSSYPAGRYYRLAWYTRVEKRASKGLTLNAYYEYSRQFDDYSGPYGRQDYFSRRNEWSLTAYNNPHRLSLSYIYELPIGPNKPFLSYSDWRRVLTDGWSVSGITTMASGEPLALRAQFNNTGTVLQTVRVNVVPGVKPDVEDRGPDSWFNPDAFSHPADFSLGDGPRTHPTILGPGSQNHDLSLAKRFVITPERSIEFTTAAFNFINHANWNDPDPVIGPPSAPNVNAGKIIGSRGGRVIQLGLRFNF